MTNDKFQCDICAEMTFPEEHFHCCKYCRLKVLNTRASGWVSVKDKLPNYSGTYLTWNGTYVLARKYVHNELQFNCDIQKNSYFTGFSNFTAHKRVTHWMPLPTPPKEAEE